MAFACSGPGIQSTHRERYLGAWLGIGRDGATQYGRVSVYWRNGRADEPWPWIRFHCCLLVGWRPTRPGRFGKSLRMFARSS